MNERPRFALGAYRRLSKTALFLAFADTFCESEEIEPVGELDEDALVAEVNRRACALRIAGWSTQK